MHTTEQKMIWLDTDIGTDIDDALTLSYLLGRTDVELLGISTVTVSAVERAKLAAGICREMGQPNLRVFAGADRPLIHPSRQTDYSQTAALDPALAEQLDAQVAKTGAAVEAMYRAALRWPREIHLLAIGPLTNLALLVRTHPDVVDLLASVTLMAGRFFGPALHEWNIWCDPHAANIVFESYKDIRTVGLDVTLQTTRPVEEIKAAFAPAGPTVARTLDIFVEKHAPPGICLHDPLAAACLVDEGILGFERGLVQVETNPGVTEGVTVFQDKSDGPHLVAKTVDLPRFRASYEQTLRQFRGQG